MLRDFIIHHIQSAGGRIPFSEFMRLCLYHSEWGYYVGDRPKLGKSGDFYTSAHIGSAMGQCVAVRVHEAAQQMAPDGEPVAIFEWGGGDGRLAGAMLDELRDAFPATYGRCAYIGVEQSPSLRERQRQELARHGSRAAVVASPDDPVAVRRLTERPSFVMANELLDAFPVRRLRRIGGSWKELYVEWDAEGEAFRETAGPYADDRLRAFMAGQKWRGKEGQTIEVGLSGLDWIRELAGRMRRGFVWLADYGDVTGELTAPHRMNGTLLCYRRHRASDDPYLHVGEQDMTSHVNFEWCMEAAEAAGFCDIRLTTQKSFLVEHGVLDRLKPHDGADPFSPEARSNRAIRQLLLSDGMSELFKVLTMRKESGRPAGEAAAPANRAARTQ